MLLRLAANKIKQGVYKNKLKYFLLTVPNEKLKRITLMFLNQLCDYNYQVTGDMINVFRNNTEYLLLKDDNY